jgi:DNA-binding transcriptional LysR family regulator
MDVMDLELLRTFVAVARSGSVNLAANELQISQASVSRHVQRLEAAIGADLFVRRDGRALALTAAGRRILDPTVGLLDDSEQEWRRLRMLAGNAGRRLAVGLGPGIALMPEATEAIADFVSRHPRVETQVVEHRNGSQAVRDLLSGRLDVALTALRGDGHGDEVTAVPIVALGLHVVVRAKHRLARRTSLTVADVADESFVFLDDSDAMQLFNEVGSDAEIVPRVTHRCEQTTTLFALLNAGDNATVLLAEANSLPGVLGRRFRTIPLDAGHQSVTLSVAWNAARPPVTVADEILRLARQAADTRARRTPEAAGALAHGWS